jgi:hypothetical protein
MIGDERAPSALLSALKFQTAFVALMVTYVGPPIGVEAWRADTLTTAMHDI